jgi:hypothetical protein
VLARVACLTGLGCNLPDYTVRPPKDYQWHRYVEPIRQGVPANIPILPENWTLEYRGRPRTH